MALSPYEPATSDRTTSVLAISSIAYPITVLGPGQRVALWTQGCAIACAGCASKDTWDPTGGVVEPITSVASRLRAGLERPECSGLTVSGGEPTEQATAVVELLSLLRPVMRDDQDILLFSGRRTERLEADFGDLLRLVDAVVAGPYLERAQSNLQWRASANQELKVFSERGQRRYEPFMQTEAHSQVQLVEQDGVLTIVGMPKAGDLDRLRANLAEQGVRVAQSSWSAIEQES